MSIATELREAAMGPTPTEAQEHAASWIGGNKFGLDSTWCFVDDVACRPAPLLHGLTDAERRMFLLFCSYAAEDDGK